MRKEPSDENSLRIRRGRVGSVDLYEVKDTELDMLEKGPPEGLYLNFAIFLLSIAFSALAVLCTTITFKYQIIQTVFVVVLVVGFLLGALLLLLWFRGRQDIAEVIREIRNRIPPEPAAAPPTSATKGIPAEEQPVEPKG